MEWRGGRSLKAKWNRHRSWSKNSIVNSQVMVAKECCMNWDIFSGHWKHFKGKIKVRWGRFNDDHFDVIDGKRIQSQGLIQKANGIARDKNRNKERKWT